MALLPQLWRLIDVYVRKGQSGSVYDERGLLVF